MTPKEAVLQKYIRRRTKGPWAVKATKDSRGLRLSVVGPTGKQLCGLRNEHVADANLIAAAPDLYEALRRLHGICLLNWPEGDYQPSEMAKAAAVLAKVEAAHDLPR